MFIFPWIEGDWSYVQKVWNNWQTFNAAALAFVASVIALYATKYRYIEETKNEFTAARAMLPHNLSELNRHLKECANFYQFIYDQSRIHSNCRKLDQKTNVETELSFTLHIQSCIKYGPPTLSKHLTNILSDLQVVDSRIKGHSRSIDLEAKPTLDTDCIESEISALCKLYALLLRTYEFARNETDEIDTTSKITEEEMSTSMNLLKLEIINANEETN